MRTPAEITVIVSTTPDAQTAEKIAKVLLKKRLCACVNIVPGIRSLFHWEGKIESQTECMLFIKTRKTLFSKVSRAIKAHHPYTVPEVISLPVAQAQSDFLAWLVKETSSPSSQ